MRKLNLFLITAILLCITISCGKTKLSTKERTFCENYFLAYQAVDRNPICQNSNLLWKGNFDAAFSLLQTVSSKGYKDTRLAFSVPEGRWEEREAYQNSVLQKLGLESGNILFVYDPPLKQPNLKATLVEKLDNGNKIWLIQDYLTMMQARLIVTKDGEMNIGNLTELETYVGY